MLPSVSTLNSNILALPPVDTPIAGATQFIGVVASFMNQVQAGPTGTAGILTYNNAVAIPLIVALPPVADNSWIPNFAAAIHAGSTAAILVPGTVTSPAWTASGVDTLPPVNTGLTTALSTLISDLATVTSENNPAMPMAQAIYNYTKAFTFLCTGIVAATPPFPLPLTFSAQ